MKSSRSPSTSLFGIRPDIFSVSFVNRSVISGVHTEHPRLQKAMILYRLRNRAALAKQRQ